VLKSDLLICYVEEQKPKIEQSDEVAPANDGTDPSGPSNTSDHAGMSDLLYPNTKY
jgi:hypothetical protein